jgi:hypothetical protein
MITALITVLATLIFLGACTEATVAPTTEPPPSPAPAPTPAPVLKPAEFQLVSLEVTPKILAFGDEATATVQVCNTGEVEGCYTCILEIADLTMNSKEVTLAGGASDTVSLTFIPNKVGLHEVMIGELTQTIEVRRPASLSVVPWAFVVLPNPVEPGTNALVNVDIINDGDIEGSDTITLEINGEAVESKEVTIVPGGKETVKFSPVVIDIPGEYQLSVKGETRSLIVAPLQEPPETGTFIVKEMTTGPNRMTIENKLLSDAVVVLCKENSTTPLIAVYIQFFDKYTISKIKRGTYNLYWTTGQYWDDESKKFLFEASYLRSPMEYECLSSASKYWKWYIELVPGGVIVAEEDFPNLITSH